jgi:hypothetical protein
MTDNVLEGEFIQASDNNNDAGRSGFNKENLPLDYSQMAISGVKLPEGSGFGRAVAQLLNGVGYGVFPANGEGKPKVGYADKYRQEDLCPLNDEKFIDSPVAYVVMDDDEQALLWIDCDCYKEGAQVNVRELMMEVFGIDEQLFNQALFQHNDDETSVHLVFKLSRGIRKEIIKDRNKGDNFFATNMKTKDDARIPEHVEVKIGRKYNQCRLKPRKTIYPKSRDMFPTMPDMLTDILMTVKINNAREAKARAAPVTPFRSTAKRSNDVDQLRRGQRGTKILDGILGEITSARKGDRNDIIVDKASQAGYYCESWGFLQSEVLGKLFDAVDAVSKGGDRRGFRKTAKSCFEYGLAHPQIQPLDD